MSVAAAGDGPWLDEDGSGSAVIRVACENSLLPTAKAAPLMAPAEAPPMMGKGLPRS